MSWNRAITKAESFRRRSLIGFFSPKARTSSPAPGLGTAPSPLAARIRFGWDRRGRLALLTVRRADGPLGLTGVLCVTLAVVAVFLARPSWLATTGALRREAEPKDPRDRKNEALASLASTRDEPSRGQELYAARCAVCHGASGDGLGQAARYLFPRPRDFGVGGLQLASTDNGVASLEDVERVLARGMPGTAMQAFDGLSISDRRLLAQEVLRLRREAVYRQVAGEMRRAGEEPVEPEVREAVERMTTPGRPIAVPGSWSLGETAVARGRAAYRALGCVQCHGDDGRGAVDQALFDAQGEPNRARDLVHEPFKGGRDRESIYVRVVVGMPGTAHPAAPGLPEEQVKDLVEYVLSLAQPPERRLTNHDRRTYADGRRYHDRFYP